PASRFPGTRADAAHRPVWVARSGSVAGHSQWPLEFADQRGQGLAIIGVGSFQPESGSNGTAGAGGDDRRDTIFGGYVQPAAQRPLTGKDQLVEIYRPHQPFGVTGGGADEAHHGGTIAGDDVAIDAPLRGQRLYFRGGFTFETRTAVQ